MLTVASANRLPLASEIFHSCITSPPYYGLREYHGSQVDKWPPVNYAQLPGTKLLTPCAAWEGALGSEPTIDMYVGHMVHVCREIKRVLRPDGTFWLNIGDSYNGSGGAGGDYGPGGIREGQPKYRGRSERSLQSGGLMMVPARLALALQADGWILRNDNVWSKHPMPEPRKGWRWERRPCPCVTERREKHIQQQMAEQGVERHRVYDKAGTKFEPDPECEQCHGFGRYGEHIFKPESWRHTKSHEYVFQLVKKMGYYSDHLRAATPTGANPKSVMTPERTNYSGKHFAVFPPALIAPMVHASVPKRCCTLCAKPWAPVVEIVAGNPAGEESYQRTKAAKFQQGGSSSSTLFGGKDKHNKYYVEGYRPTCSCSVESARQGPDPRPGLVLDPFMGSGTTGLVAREFGVRFVGCDISFEYLDEQAKVRTKTGQPSKALEGLPLFEENNDE